VGTLKRTQDLNLKYNGCNFYFIANRISMLNKLARYILLLISLSLISSCGTEPIQLNDEESSLPIHLGRAQSQTQNDITVHVSIPNADEAELYFGVEMAKSNIQPIWIRIENSSDTDYWLLPFDIDTAYYSADETAFITSKHFDKDIFENKKLFLRNNAMPFFSKANSINEGYIYATHKRGGRFVDIHLTGHLKMTRMRFAMLLPTQGFDYEKSELREMYSKVHEFPDLTTQELREYLRETLPCCSKNADDTGNGDPLNIVLIGTGEVGISALSASGWKFTEAITIKSIRKMIGAAIEDNAFPSAPISALYAFGRKQDVALQRGRSTIDRRNYMRLWLAPFRCEGKPVWIGQISRDIGVKLTSKSRTFTTHIIDPNIDEAREYLLHSLLHSESVSQFAFVQGVGQSLGEYTRKNLTDDPYITDGMRMVVWLSSKPVPSYQALNLGWNESADPSLEIKSQSILEGKGNSIMVSPLN